MIQADLGNLWLPDCDKISRKKTFRIAFRTQIVLLKVLLQGIAVDPSVEHADSREDIWKALSARDAPRGHTDDCVSSHQRTAGVSHANSRAKLEECAHHARMD